jgi:hypothetical protein
MFCVARKEKSQERRPGEEVVFKSLVEGRQKSHDSAEPSRLRFR